MSSILDSEFLFGSDHRLFEESVASLARREFYDGYLRRATSDEMCWAELRALGKHGLLCLNLPEELGGQNADPISLGIACEHMAIADFNLSYLVFASTIASALMALETDVAAPITQSLAAGEQLLAVALTEPRGGSDASATSVRAQLVKDGFLLTGEKTSVTLGMHASHAIVVATTDPAGGTAATRRLLVSLEDPSIKKQRFSDLGFRPLSRAALSFDDTFVPANHEIVAKVSALSAQLFEFDLTRTLLGLMALGAARRALDTTVEWVRERHSFNKPIAGFQGVSFTLAEHATELEAARWLCYRALGLRSAGITHTKEAAMCKWWAPKVAMATINDCIVLHGHVGWSAEMPLQQLALDVSGLQIGDGTPQIQKLIIARHLIGRSYVG